MYFIALFCLLTQLKCLSMVMSGWKVWMGQPVGSASVG